jgi:hypothetical protein
MPWVCIPIVSKGKKGIFLTLPIVSKKKRYFPDTSKKVAYIKKKRKKYWKALEVTSWV